MILWRLTTIQSSELKMGEVTGREIGGCVTNLGLRSSTENRRRMHSIMPPMLKMGIFCGLPPSIFTTALDSPSVPCASTRILRIPRILKRSLREYNNTHDYENREDASPKEVFMPDVHEPLNRLIDQCIQKYGKPPKLLTKEEKNSVYRGSGYEGGLCDHEGQRSRLLAAWDFPIHILYISGAGEENAWGKPDSCRIKCLSKRHIFCLDIERIIVLKYNQT